MSHPVKIFHLTQDEFSKIKRAENLWDYPFSELSIVADDDHAQDTEVAIVGTEKRLYELPEHWQDFVTPAKKLTITCYELSQETYDAIDALFRADGFDDGFEQESTENIDQIMGTLWLESAEYALIDGRWLCGLPKEWKDYFKQATGRKYATKPKKG